jgi:hypothetical protein
MEEAKTALLEALATKCTALLDAEEVARKDSGKGVVARKEAKEGKEGKEAGKEVVGEKAGKEGKEVVGERDAFTAAFAELRRWVDTSADAKYVMLHSRAEERAGRLASAYRVLDKAADPEDKAASKEVVERRAMLLEKLGWVHWAKFSRSRLIDLFPSALPPV